MFCIEKNKVLFCMRESIYPNDKRGHSQKADREIYVLYSLQIYKQSFESVHITLQVTDVSCLVFSEDPSIPVVKEK